MGLALLLCVACWAKAWGQSSWAEALASMPLTNVAVIDRTNGIQAMLNAFRSNGVVKGLVFMPGATDEFYMFKRVRAVLPFPSPTLLTAVQALTNQTLLRVSYRPPLLLLHTREDFLDPLIEVKHAKTVETLKQAKFAPQVNYWDRDWDAIYPQLSGLGVKVWPPMQSYDSWHFYRHSFAAWNLSGWEALQATALAGKSRIKVSKGRVRFEPDPRIGPTPPAPKDDSWRF